MGKEKNEGFFFYIDFYTLTTILVCLISTCVIDKKLNHDSIMPKLPSCIGNFFYAKEIVRAEKELWCLVGKSILAAGILLSISKKKKKKEHWHSGCANLRFHSSPCLPSTPGRIEQLVYNSTPFYTVNIQPTLFWWKMCHYFHSEYFPSHSQPKQGQFLFLSLLGLENLNCCICCNFIVLCTL